MRRLLVYGNSLFLNGLALHLQRANNLIVTSRSVLKDLGDLAAFDAVLVDLNDQCATDAFELLRARPDLPIIAVNPSTHIVTQWAGKVYLAQNLQEVEATLAEF